MPYKKKAAKNNTKKIMLIIAIVLTVLVLACAGVFAFFAYQKDQEAKAAAALDALPRIVVPEGHFATTAVEPASVKNGVKAATIKAGVDIYADIAADQAAVEAEVDKLLADIESLSFNTIMLDTAREQSVCFGSTQLEKTPVDLLKILTTKAAEKEIAVSVIFNLTGVNRTDGTALTSFLPFENRELMANAVMELAQNYELNSILLDNYYAKKGGDSYAVYQKYGSSGAYETWLKDNVKIVIDQVRNEARIAKETLPIGMMVSSVWAHDSSAENGSKTKNAFEALVDGNADTKALVESGAVDFIDVKIPTSLTNGDVSFNTAVTWWGGICKAANIPMYVNHSGENAVNPEVPGWNATDELPRQVIAATTSGNYYGSAFTGISRLLSNPSKSTDYLVNYLKGLIPPADVGQGIEVISPKGAQTSTYEESVQVKLKFDPNAEVMLNGQKVEPSSRGGASVYVPLEVGKNSIKLEHKGRTTVFSVERKIEIFKEVSPVGSIKVAGSSTIEVSALAYKDSKITAKINGQTITLTEGGGGDEDLAESAYKTYTGEYTVPKATAKEQNIGGITFSGNYQGIYTQGAKGASVIIDKLADEVDPDDATGKSFTHATVTSLYAATFPFKTTGYPQAIQYQLPQGTQDIVVSENGEYLNLRSGVTVLKSDVSLETKNFEGNNQVTQMTVGVEGNDTVIRATMNWKSPFSLNLSPYTTKPLGRENYNFAANTVTILLDYNTVIRPENVTGDMSSSPIFSGISYERIKNEALGTWQYAITLPMRQAGRYYGCHAQWEDNTLVLKFNHPATGGSLSGMKIAVDPGHGGSEPGNMAGRDVIEKDINLTVAFKLKAALEAQGAQVIITRDSDTYLSLNGRALVSQQNEVDLFISVHQNSVAPLTAPYGVQTYYNAPFSQPLAKYVEESLKTVAPQSKWNYWNGSVDRYNFVVTRQRQYPSILVECAFLSNYEDEARILDENYQTQLMNGVVQGVINYYNAYN